jgi:hypothetical protein
MISRHLLGVVIELIKLKSSISSDSQITPLKLAGNNSKIVVVRSESASSKKF